MDIQNSALLINQTWTLVPLPRNRTAIPCKWMYNLKQSNGKIERFNARLVARGNNQIKGIDYTKTFAPVAKMTSICILIGLAFIFKFQIKQSDIVTAFLNGFIDEDIYMSQPEGYNDHLEKYYKLNKLLYGLCQAARACYTRLDKILMQIGFKGIESDSAIWVKPSTNTSIRSFDAISACHVDNMLRASTSDINQQVLEHLQKYVKVKDKGELSTFLGIKYGKRENSYFAH